jgi:hypothetical protein
MKLFNFLTWLQPNPAKQLRDLCPQTPSLATLVLGRIPEDFTDFFFHAAAVTLGAALQASFDFVFEIANKDLRHNSPAIMIALWHLTDYGLFLACFQ